MKYVIYRGFSEESEQHVYQAAFFPGNAASQKILGRYHADGLEVIRWGNAQGIFVGKELDRVGHRSFKIISDAVEEANNSGNLDIDGLVKKLNAVD